MQLTDLPKDARRFLLEHWTESELSSRLQDPEYFFDQVVAPRLEYLKRNGQEPPRIRFQRLPNGQAQIIFLAV